MFQLSAMIAAAYSGHIFFALAAMAAAQWWHGAQRLELAEATRPERLVQGLLPPANAPPGAAGGRP